MRFLRRLEQTFGRFAIPQLTMAIIVLQGVTYLLTVTQANPQPFLEQIALIPAKVLEGEVWRLVTFVAMPPVVGAAGLNVFWALIFWYVFYLMGNALEQQWGTFRYNLYILVWYLATIAVSFLQPDAVASNIFLKTSVFLAFAFLYPEFTFLLFFILPVKVKWLAMLTWLFYGFLFLFGDWMTRLLIFASLGNFFLFFWREILERLQTGQRRMSRQLAQVAATKEPSYRHRCAVCGKTDQTHPDEDFRYCSKCIGQQAYCSEHLRNHEHVVDAEVERAE
jgi:hypothetical protein